MDEPVNAAKRKRSYESPLRAERAAATRRAILDAARRSFVERGWAGTTMADIAREAEVNLDTVYAAVGRKDQLFTLLLEIAISGGDQPVSAEDRDYVRRIHNAADPVDKLRVYAQAVSLTNPRLAPLAAVAAAAGPRHSDVADSWRTISERRAANMRHFAAELAATGRLRHDLTVERAADIVWATNSPEFWSLIVAQRGWSTEQYVAWLTDTWVRTLLEPQPGHSPPGRDSPPR